MPLKNFDTVFSSWYEEILTLANKVGVAEFVPRKTSLQQPSESPSEHSTKGQLPSL